MNSIVRLLPPYDTTSARRKVRLAEDAWNSRDPKRVALSYSLDSEWRNRDEFIKGRQAIERFLTQKWEKELEYRLVKELWTHSERKMAVRFQYEWQDRQGLWHRSYGNELWEFDDEGLMQRREASINDISIRPEERKFFWDSAGPRPDNHAGIESVR
jgi:nuclear transport factor 2 (NTF2) superfamily protein